MATVTETKSFELTRPLPESPLVVSYGAGLDSTGVLILFQRNGIVPDLIITADTGGEKPETWAACAAVSDWCESVGFPPVTVVKYAPEKARYADLEGNCLQNETIPSLAFGKGGCSDKWKVKVIDAYLKTWAPAVEAVEAGRKIVRVVGYDFGSADTKRTFKACSANAKKAKSAWQPWHEWYPLRDPNVELGRPGLEKLVASEPELAKALEAVIGQAFPIKSACFFCPAARKHELDWLVENHPEMALRGAVMEHRARWGKHGLEVAGLGRDWSWEEHLKGTGFLGADWTEEAKATGLLPEDWESYKAQVAPGRERVVAARKALKAARKAAKIKAKEFKALLELEEELDGSAPLHWTEEILTVLEVTEELEAATAAKNGLPLVSDWASKAQPTVTKAERKAKLAANKRWKVALAAAKTLPLAG